VGGQTNDSTMTRAAAWQIQVRGTSTTTNQLTRPLSENILPSSDSNRYRGGVGVHHEVVSSPEA